MQKFYFLWRERACWQFYRTVFTVLGAFSCRCDGIRFFGRKRNGVAQYNPRSQPADRIAQEQYSCTASTNTQQGSDRPSSTSSLPSGTARDHVLRHHLDLVWACLQSACICENQLRRYSGCRNVAPAAACSVSITTVASNANIVFVHCISKLFKKILVLHILLKMKTFASFNLLYILILYRIFYIASKMVTFNAHSKKCWVKKNNPFLTTLLGHYGSEHTLGWFDPAAGLDHFNPDGWVDYLTDTLCENNYIARINLTQTKRLVAITTFK